MREATIEDADKTEGKNGDLVHCDGGTLGLGDGEDLNKDDEDLPNEGSFQGQGCDCHRRGIRHRRSDGASLLKAQ